MAIGRQSVSLIENKATFTLTKPHKAQREEALHDITTKKFASRAKLYPVDCLGYHVFVTNQLRNAGNSQNLFFTTVRPRKVITGSSLGRRIKVMLEEAGVDTSSFTANSARSAAASRSGISIETSEKPRTLLIHVRLLSFIVGM